MKNYPTVESREPGVEDKTIVAPPAFRPQPSTLNPQHAFTLVELLTVISIIALLAAFTVAVLGGAKKSATLNHAKAELAQLETAIDSYKQDHGFYPPGNATVPASANNYLVNQLYYELEGTTNNTSTSFQTLDGSSTITNNVMVSTFGVGGFMNCAKGSGEESLPAKNYLIGLPSNQIGDNGSGVKLLVTSVGGPLATYQPIGQADVNPWRYNSSNPTNNPGAYDLWVQIVIKPGQTNLICNWTKQVQLNSPLP